MKIGLLSNELLNPHINWTTLSPPLYSAMSMRENVEVVAAPRLRLSALGDWCVVAQRLWRMETVFWMQGSARPRPPVHLAAYLNPRVRRAAFVIDAWRPALRKIGLLAELQKLNPCFIAFREGQQELQAMYPRARFEWLPFGIDVDVFSPTPDGERPIFAFWMGRRYEPLHQALLAYCEARKLRYEYRRDNRLLTTAELGELAGRSKYFVVTPPDLDQPERTGGFSPLVMRYMEGLSAGARLLGVLPRSGEFEQLLPRSVICEVAPDGSDLAARLDADQREADWDAVRAARELVVRDHSWERRAEQIFLRLSSGTPLHLGESHG